MKAAFFGKGSVLTILLFIFPLIVHASEISLVQPGNNSIIHHFEQPGTKADVSFSYVSQNMTSCELLFNETVQGAHVSDNGTNTFTFNVKQFLTGNGTIQWLFQCTDTGNDKINSSYHDLSIEYKPFSQRFDYGVCPSTLPNTVLYGLLLLLPIGLLAIGIMGNKGFILVFAGLLFIFVGLITIPCSAPIGRIMLFMGGFIILWSFIESIRK